MSGNVAPGDIFAGGGLPFVNAEMKAELARTKTPLGIVGADPKATNQFGDEETAFIIRTKGEDYKLTLSHNDVRERQAKAICSLLAGGAESVGPVYLVQVTTKSGQKAWALANEPGDGTVEAQAAATSDDGIPF